MNISKSEYSVLLVLWDQNPVTVGQIVERVQVNNEWHENTVKTLLTRLVEKQAVSRYKDGKRFFYAPAISQDEILLGESEGFLSQFFGGRMAPLVAHFARNKKLSAGDIEEIESILEKMKKDAD